MMNEDTKKPFLTRQSKIGKTTRNTVLTVLYVSLILPHNYKNRNEEMNMTKKMKKTEEHIDIDDLLVGSNDVVSALKGLEGFVDEKIQMANVTVENISIMNGLLAAIVALSINHASRVERYEEQG